MSVITATDVEQSASDLLADLYTAAHITHGDGQANLHATVRGWLAGSRLQKPADVLLAAGKRAAAERVQGVRHLMERERDAVCAVARGRLAPAGGSRHE